MKNSDIIFGIMGKPQGTQKYEFSIVNVKGTEKMSDLTMRLMTFYSDIKIIQLEDFVRIKNDAK